MNRRKYARGVINRLKEQLEKGWTPWIQNEVGDLQTFEEAMGRYETHIEKMMGLKVRDFNLKKGTITIPAAVSKNKREQTVTVPKKVLFYAMELGVFSAPSDDFIFSFRLKPGPEEIDAKHFRDHWENLRKSFGLKREWKFYSLKDTGITEMLRAKMPAISVRDQARHSSLAITEIYTDHSDDVNPGILNLDGAL